MSENEGIVNKIVRFRTPLLRNRMLLHIDTLNYSENRYGTIVVSSLY